MKQNPLLLALSFLASAAVAGPPIEGEWRNPRNSVVVRVAPCGGGAWCGTVIRASEKVKDDARKGGNAKIVGMKLLTDLKPTTGGAYRGRVYLPKHRITANATVRPESTNSMVVKGCAIMSLLCREQRWKRTT